jgi:hypothetical protein
VLCNIEERKESESFIAAEVGMDGPFALQMSRLEMFEPLCRAFTL